MLKGKEKNHTLLNYSMVYGEIKIDIYKSYFKQIILKTVVIVYLWDIAKPN